MPLHTYCFENETCSVMSDPLRSHGQYSPWNSPGQNTGVGILQGIFTTQGLNPGLLHCRQSLYQLSHKGSPRILEWVAYLFSSRSSWPKNQTRVSCIAGGFFTNWAIREASLNWSIVNSQCRISFKCTVKWFSYIYILFQIIFHYRLLQDNEYSSLCYVVGPPCLPILYTNTSFKYM